MNQPSPKHETSRPIPIPRTGIAKASSVFLHILLCLTSVTIPLGVASAFDILRIPALAAEIYSIALLLFIGVYFFRLGKLVGKKSRGFLPILIFGSILLFYLSGSAMPAALLFSTIFHVGEGAMLLATYPKKSTWIFPLVPLFSFGISAMVCQGLDVALLSLSLLPATIALAVGTRSSAAGETGLTRVGVICSTSLWLGITAAGLAAWFLHKSLGTLEISALQELLDNLRNEITISITQLHMETPDGIIYPFEGKETLISDAVITTFNIIPGIFVAVCNIIAAFSQMLTLSGLNAFGFGTSVTDRVRNFKISVISSFVFLAAWVVALIANAETITIAGTVAENFTIILLPGMALAGLLRLMQTLAKKGCAPGCLIFFLLLIPGISMYLFIILAMYEAIVAVFGPLVAKLKPPKNDDDDLFPPHQDDQNPPND